MHESYTCNTSISFNNTQSGVTFEEPFEKACLESIYCTCIVISATNINILIVMIHEASHECKLLSNFLENVIDLLSMRLCMKSWDLNSSNYLHKLATCIATVSARRYDSNNPRGR